MMAMTRLRIFAQRVLGLFRKGRLDSALDEELRAHLELEAEELQRQGLPADEARYAARRRFGGIEQTKEAWRDQRSLPGVEAWLKDLKLAVRTLGRSPGFTLFAVLSLALGIGANTAMFTVFRAMVLRPFDYPNPERLVAVWETLAWQGEPIWGSVSYPNLTDWRAENSVFEAIAAYGTGGVLLSRDEETMRLPAAHLEAEVFRVAKVGPALGRTILPEDNRAGQHRVVVLSHGLWTRLFAADPAAIGRTVEVNGADHTIVGVMPDGFQFPPRSPVQLWTPLVIPRGSSSERRSHWLQVVARLRPGVSPSTAQANMDEIAGRLRERYAENATRGAVVRSFHVQTVRDTARVLVVLLGAVGLILLLACANVAHLVLARVGARRRELAVRIAMGASRWRIVRLLSAEVIVLAVAGGLAGLALSEWARRALLLYAADYLPAGVPVEIDGAVLATCLAFSIGSAVLAGVVPAVRASGVDPVSMLKEAGPSAGARLGRSRSFLLSSEVALSVVLVIGAVLLLRSLAEATRIDVGFRPAPVLTMQVVLPEERFGDRHSITRFYDRALLELAGVPGVRSAGFVSLLPIQSTVWNGSISIEGRPPDAPGREPGAEYRIVSPDYFAAMGIPVVEGRAFGANDVIGSERVVIVNRRLAERYFPDGKALGRRIAEGLTPAPDRWMTVVGVVGNVLDFGLSRPTPTVMYVPVSQTADVPATMSLVVRAAVPPQTLSETVQRRIRSIDLGVGIFLARTMERVLSDSIAGTRVLSRLLSLFGALAIALALVGVYGVMSWLVSCRRHEIGVRIAVGAARGRVAGFVLGNAVRIAVGGALVGTGLAVVLGFGLRRFVVGISVVDPVTFLGAVAGVLLVVVVASVVPAWRAARVDPVLALRDE